MATNSGFNIYHNLLIKASIKKVFDAISKPSELESWWPLKCSGKPEEGEEYNFFFGEPYNWFGKVVKCKENTSFHIKMTQSDEDWNPTTFGFDLEEKDNGTYLKFFHRGWQQENDHFKHSSFCWAILLNGLKNYVEKGTVIPFENRN